ncbi:MAG TPA: FHA domain-containing protein [Syntrophobacteria bacterium]|nr:FHA domain-containing protein [Syntrophobacteria bacterium]
MASVDRRAYPRVDHRLFTKFSKAGLYTPVEGVTENISQGGAFVTTDAWETFSPCERAIVTFFLSPDLTGQDKTLGLQGEGIIARVDREGTGVGVQFASGFDQFAEIELLDIKHKVRYKRLSYYLIEAASLPLPEFTRQYPDGFLVEQSKHLFDKKIIVKFDTDVIDNRDSVLALQRDIGRKKTLDLRVIEINTKPSLSRQISIGRSPNNDIVLHSKFVSKFHASLYIAARQKYCYLIDVESTNGTFVNGHRLTPHQEYRLADGDEISFGPRTKVVYFSPEGFYSFLELPIS